MIQYSNTDMQTDMFTAGQQDTLKDAQIAIAKFVCHLHYIYQIPQDKKRSPLLILRMIKILEWNNKKDFKSWVDRRLSAQPWIPHQLLEMVHNYIVQWVNLAKDNNLVRDFHEQRLGEYNHEIFLGTETSFKHIQDCLTGVGTNNTR